MHVARPQKRGFPFPPFYAIPPLEQVTHFSYQEKSVTTWQKNKTAAEVLVSWKTSYLMAGRLR